MPRNYRLQRRADRAEATRARIVQAAVELYTERGAAATTLKAVGQRADVAPGTLRKHFPDREMLDAAVVERAMAEMPLPEPRIFDGATTIESRLGRLLRATVTFLDQAAPWYRMWQREPMITGPWAVAGARFGAHWDALIRTTLGPLADDPEATAVLRAAMEPTFVDQLRSSGGSSEQVADLITDVLAPWFIARETPARSED